MIDPTPHLTMVTMRESEENQRPRVVSGTEP